ncbi:MAG: prephenate dehydratase [Dysgonamonadaceae bacterium]|jgi:prephenate dehydratase|nr:prephenate dehydratase [Dysgonamonadaceae bacterium]
MIKVAIQGVEGAYHEIAAREYFGEEEIQILPCNLFKDVIIALKKDPSLIGIMAIENTIAGSLLQNHELIRESDLTIIGEKKLRISHCLAALPGESLHAITEINSHPIALMQCGDFLETLPNIKVVEKEDTALSARDIAQKELHGVAAICSRHAAKLYGLDILSEGIETNKRNFTRFLLIANRWVAEEILRDATLNKSSLVFTLPHTEGSLSKVLTILSFYDINLTKIQSLPIIGREWEYLFYIDLTFNNYMRYKQAVDAVRPLIKDFKVLGEYEKVDN